MKQGSEGGELFGSDMNRISGYVLVHIKESDVIRSGGRGELHRVMRSPCGSAGRDIQVREYPSGAPPKSCSEFLRGVSQAWRGVVQSFGGVSCSEFSGDR